MADLALVSFLVAIRCGMAEEAAVRLDARQQQTGEALAKAAAIMARLRGPEGCPWDREQTFDSIKRHTLEETYEVFDAIERRAWPELRDELGDLLLQVLFMRRWRVRPGTSRWRTWRRG